MDSKMILSALLVFAAALSGCTSTPGTDQNQTLDQACTSSGGTVTTGLCCSSVSDFPNTCLIGACGCSPDNSKTVKTCDCGSGKCFNGTACVAV